MLVVPKQVVSLIVAILLTGCTIDYACDKCLIALPSLPDCVIINGDMYSLCPDAGVDSGTDVNVARLVEAGE